MKEKVQNYKKILELIAEQEKNLNIMKTTYEDSIKPIIEGLNTLKEKLDIEKKNIEESILKEFKETGNKKFVGGIGVQERKTVEYDEKKVFEWALDKKMFLSLDKKAFEKVAENIGAPTVVIGKKTIVTFPKEIVLED